MQAYFTSVELTYIEARRKRLTMSWFGNDKPKEEEHNIYLKDDGSSIDQVRSNGRTDYYLKDPNDRYENDPRHRDHGHVVIKDDNNGRERVAYVRNGHGDSKNFDKDWDKNDNSSNSGGGCYIATASLQGAMPIEVLDPLKEWRYTILEKSSFGNRLSGYYRRTAPSIAKEIAGMPRVSAFLRNTIVKPAVSLANRPSSLARNVALYSLFLIGLSIAEVVKVLRK